MSRIAVQPKNGEIKMAGFLSKVTHGVKSVDVRHKGGLVGHLFDTGETLGGAYLAARLNTQYGDRAKYRDVEITYIAGLAGKAVAVVADIFGWRMVAPLVPHLNSTAMGLLSAHLAAKGASDGLASRSIPGAGTKKQIVGHISQAAPGKWLDNSEISRLAHMHG